MVFDSHDLATYGERAIYVDMIAGKILADQHFSQGSVGDAIVAWQYPLHSGKTFGWPGRIAIFIQRYCSLYFDHNRNYHLGKKTQNEFKSFAELKQVSTSDRSGKNQRKSKPNPAPILFRGNILHLTYVNLYMWRSA